MFGGRHRAGQDLSAGLDSARVRRVRRLFALPENIALSNFSIPFFERFEADMSVNDEPARIDFKKNGYLFIVAPKDVAMLRKKLSQLQQENGVNVVWLDQAGLKSKFPSMNVTDLAAAGALA